MNVVDSSGWLEYLADAPNADFFAAAIKDATNLIVPTISVLEVFKRILQQRSETEALVAAAFMRRGRVIDLDTGIALSAAKLGSDHGLPLADSVILATARQFDATLWTQDRDFQGIDKVRYIAKS